MNNLNSKKKGALHILAGLMFCLVLSIGTVCFAATGTVSVTSAKIRASADTSASVLASVSQGQSVDVIASTTGTDGNTWYQVWVDANTKGYIRSDLVSVDGTVSTTTENTASTTTTTTEDTSETAVTAVEAKAAYVTTDNVRIRKGASTNHGIVGTAKKGMTVTVTGEATGSDSKKWYQIQFTYNNETLTGFIRSDFITFEAISTNEAAVSEITGGTAETTETTEETTETAEETVTEEAVVEEAVEEEPVTNTVVLMDAATTPYVAPGFEQIILTMNDEDHTAYQNGSFYLLYASVNGNEGWYIFKSNDGSYSRYPYDVDATAKNTSAGVSSVIVILLVIVIAALIGLSAFLYLRLREYIEKYAEEDEDEDEEEDDEEEASRARAQFEKSQRLARENHQNREERKRRSLSDSLEDEDEEEMPREVRHERPAVQTRPQTPRRTENANPNAGNNVNRNQQRRPQGQRPAANATNTQRPQNREMRRPQNPVEQPMKKVVNQGVQAKNFIETGDDGDIEFIDL